MLKFTKIIRKFTMNKAIFKIIILMVLLVSSRAESLNYDLQNGWNLLGNSAKDFDVSTFASASSIVYKYKDGKWFVVSPDGKFDQAIDNGGFSTFTTIKKGFLLKKCG